MAPDVRSNIHFLAGIVHPMNEKVKEKSRL